MLVYERRLNDERLIIALNFSDEGRMLSPAGQLVLSTDPDRSESGSPKRLHANEGVILAPSR